LVAKRSYRPKGNAAWDCCGRFLLFHAVAFGLDRNHFDDIIGEQKHKLGIGFKRDFTGSQMKAVALARKDSIREDGVEIEEGPFGRGKSKPGPLGLDSLVIARDGLAMR
jgi:hypothetical protein